MENPTPQSLADIRQGIDELDHQIVALLCQRQRLVHGAARFKTDEDAVRAPERVEAIIARVRALAAEQGGSPDIVESIYRSMINAFITFELGEHQANNAPQE